MIYKKFLTLCFCFSLMSLASIFCLNCDDYNDTDEGIDLSGPDFDIIPNPDRLIYVNTLDIAPSRVDQSAMYKWNNNPTTGYMITDDKGRHGSWKLETMAYGYGLHVQELGRSKTNHMYVTIYPFSQNEKNVLHHDFTVGTVGFIARTMGGYRGKGDDTYCNMNVYFYLTPNIYVTLRGTASYDHSTVSLGYDGSGHSIVKIPDRRVFTNIVMQWDLADSNFSNRYVKLWVNGLLKTTITPADTETERLSCSSYLQKFFIRARVDNGGDNYPEWDHGDIDHLQIYDTIVNPDQMNIITN